MTNKEIQAINAVFDSLVEPTLKWSINSLNLLKKTEIRDHRLIIDVNLISDDTDQKKIFIQQAEKALGDIGFDKVIINLGKVNVATEGVSGVKHILLVGSGKGGVGKSNTAVNLAVAISKLGFKTGLMDGDIYGPSFPTMLGVTEKPEVLTSEYLLPIERHGMKTMSIGYLVDKGKALTWRGNLTSGTVLQFIQKTFWGSLDYLVIDLPPGTGDIPLTLAHKIKCDGVVLVTTPQNIALDDVRRAVSMFQECEIPIIGIVENMSYGVCSSCGHHNHYFPKAKPSGADDPLTCIETLCSIPLSKEICSAADAGIPLMLMDGDIDAKKIFEALAVKVTDSISKAKQLSLTETETMLEL
ncbi:MAG: ATP-binding protein involved in chromosome partitioning [Desulforhopalus sp.]|jgi:ATP-binding protein involved in chromosome partitioning